MMARKTLKYRMAQAYIRMNQLSIPIHGDNATLYDRLESGHVFWNPKDSKWEHKEHAPGTSKYANDDGTASGIGDIRITAHPENIQAFVRALKLAPGMRLIDVSDKTYPNRKGVGHRIYTMAILDGDA